MIAVAELGQRLRDFQPGGEVAMILVRQARPKRAQDFPGRIFGIAVEAEVAGDARIGAVEIGKRLGIGAHMAAIARQRRAKGAPRVAIITVDQMRLGQRQGRVDILVRGAVSRQARGQAVAIVLQPGAGHDDRLGGLRRRQLRGQDSRSADEDKREQSLQHGSSILRWAAQGLVRGGGVAPSLRSKYSTLALGERRCMCEPPASR